MRSPPRPPLAGRSHPPIQAPETDLGSDFAARDPGDNLSHLSDPTFILSNGENYPHDVAIGDGTGVRSSIRGCDKGEGSPSCRANEATLRFDRSRGSGRVGPVLFRGAQERGLAESLSGTSVSQGLP